MESDMWSLVIALIEMMGIRPYVGFGNNYLPTKRGRFELPFRKRDIKSVELAGFLEKGFVERVSERSSVNELLNVSVMGWRIMSSIHL